MLNTTSEPINRPCHHDIDFMSLDHLKQAVEARTVLSAFGATDPVIDKLSHDIPAEVFGALPKLKQLVRDFLMVGGNPSVNYSAASSRH